MLFEITLAKMDVERTRLAADAAAHRAQEEEKGDINTQRRQLG